MRLDRVGAFRRERADLLRFCHALDDAQWRTESAAAGWRMQDVVAHMGSACKAIFTPAAVAIMRSKDIERTNDDFVDQRRDWAPQRTLAEYEQWSGRLATLAGVVARTPAARIPMPLGELGRFPVALVLPGAIVFDTHTHLRHDMAPALGLPIPGTDEGRMAVALDWMFAVLRNQLRNTPLPWLDRPIVITLDGPGGGSRRIGAGGTVAPGPDGGAAAQIAGSALEFPEWGTHRAPWRDRDVKITGDEEYGARFLDALRIL